jgi:uncharacterized protein (TIGR01777 family)
MNQFADKLVAHKHVLITGATGFIGTNLTNQLRRRGYAVTALTRDPARCSKLLGSEVDAVAWHEDLGARTFDAVVNLAGARIAPIPWTAHRRGVLRNSRIANTERLVKSLLVGETPPKVWIQASAVGVYGMTPPSKTIDEECASGEDFASILCRDWEDAAKPMQVGGARLCILRIGLVLGKGGALPGLLFPIRMALGGPLGTGMQAFPWIHIDDLLKLIIDCLEDERRVGPFNAVAPEQHTQSTFTRCAADLLHRPYWFPTPAFLLKLLGEVSQLFLAGQQVVPKRLLEESWRWDYPELKPALASLLTGPISTKPTSEPK